MQPERREAVPLSAEDRLHVELWAEARSYERAAAAKRGTLAEEPSSLEPSRGSASKGA